MKSVNIYVIGKYEYKSKTGTWIYYLNYKDAVIKRVGTVTNAQCAIRMSLYALYMAIQQITEACNITVYAKTALGFKNPKKSSNKDLLIKIQRVVNKVGHTLKLEINTKFSEVETWEKLYNTKAQQIKTEEKSDKPSEYAPAYIEQKINDNKDWRAMYSDLMGPSEGVWQAGSGGY